MYNKFPIMNSTHLYLLLLLVLFTSISGCTHVTSSTSALKENKTSPIVIAHRGASGYLPEHTLSAALLAYQQGADYIEQDLVLSRDGVLMVLHDIHIDRVTNVADVFPDRKRADGRFYAIDFDLAELKMLSVLERFNVDSTPVFSKRYNGNATFTVATFEEQIQLIQTLNKMSGRQVGLYPEIKSPKWHRSQGKDISTLTIEMLDKYNLNHKSANIFLQCFDFNEIKRLKTVLKAKVKLVQLLAENNWNESDNNYDYLKSANGVNEIALYADGIGPWIPQLIDTSTQQATGLHQLAHESGLVVHPYTFRADSLPEHINEQQLLDLLFNQLKVDGIFSDHTDVVKKFFIDKK